MHTSLPAPRTLTRTENWNQGHGEGSVVHSTKHTPHTTHYILCVLQSTQCTLCTLNTTHLPPCTRHSAHLCTVSVSTCAVPIAHCTAHRMLNTQHAENSAYQGGCLLTGQHNPQRAIMSKAGAIYVAQPPSKPSHDPLLETGQKGRGKMWCHRMTCGRPLSAG